MKKVFTPDGTFLGRALKIETTGNGVEITMPGDFPGMAEKTVIRSEEHTSELQSQ